MLHTEVVSGKTLELLKKLEAENAMTRFNLAGGTSLALYLGHRRSVDLDLFTPKPFDAAELERFLMDKYGFRTGFMERNTLKGSIDGIKIDCITHSYEYLEKPYIEVRYKIVQHAGYYCHEALCHRRRWVTAKGFHRHRFPLHPFPFQFHVGNV